MGEVLQVNSKRRILKIRVETASGGLAMIEATSCGGVVIFRGKILLLYKNYRNKYEGWVLPKGTVEAGEEYKDTAAREVRGAGRRQRIDQQYCQNTLHSAGFTVAAGR